MIIVEIRGRKLSLCQVRNRLVQTGGYMGHGNLLVTSFSVFSVQGGQNLSISYLKQSCFSHGEGSVKDRTFHEKEKLDKNLKA